ncbi:MAG: UDP-2,4-diacetamido-2,4,6-trideoxy-beta-L-altropyranose hydrolase [Cyanobacteria bacterium]|nr:UDP-2,4-diacetamido-2,4,6-trideoxy-beta-L-altropyranose hydrolase [Cyanobacteriota bacterium]
MPKLRIAIRADSSQTMGTGHVIRCVALAHHLMQQGCEVCFFCRELPGSLNHWLEKEAKIPLQTLSDNHADTMIKALGSWLDSIQVEQNSIDWLLVDHYGLDATWENTVRQAHSETMQKVIVHKMIVIDDLANRPHDCDFLLDQNYYPSPQKRYEGLLPDSCRQLLGPRFALLRESFLETVSLKYSPSVAAGRDKPPRILLFFGGSDPDNLTLQVLHVLLDAPALIDLNVVFDVVVGDSNANKEAVKALCLKDSRCQFYCQTPEMPQLMKEASLFVGAGGSTTWERLGIGLPSVVMAIADNQVALSEALAEEGVQLYLGEITRLDSSNSQTLVAAICTVLSNTPLRKLMQAKGRALVDFQGVRRVTEIIMAKSITQNARPVLLRKANIEDCDFIYLWRNHPETRAYFLDPNPIERTDHEAWLKKVLMSDKVHLMIAEENTIPVGVLRYDLEEDNTYTVSIYLDPTQHGRGLGAKILQAGTAWIQDTQTLPCRLKAVVLSQNQASHRVFEKAGYHEVSSEYHLTVTAQNNRSTDG